jgi:hypothetical protein
MLLRQRCEIYAENNALMSLEETLFIGPHDPNPPRLPLQAILEHHAVIRDAIAGTGHIERTDLESFVANLSFIYAFNTYKAIGLLLPELYHESGAVVLRQLWEVSLNLHWIEPDVANRTRDFCNFTVMEYRKLIQKSGDSTLLNDFDDATDKFQSRFRYRDGRGRNRTYSSFATTNIHDRAVDLGDPWEREYELVYCLTSMYAHGAPGAVLHGMFQQQYSNPEIREQNSASLIAILAAKVIVRDVELLARMNIISDPSSVLKAFDAFQRSIKDVGRYTETEPEHERKLVRVIELAVQEKGPAPTKNGM